MRRIGSRPILLAAALALAVTACGGDGSALTTSTIPNATTTPDASTTTASTVPAETTTSTSTTTTTTLPSGPALATEGDNNETVEAFQWLLNCNGYGDLTIDGAFGPATLAAVEAAQIAIGKADDGAPDEETLAALSRTCSEDRRITPDTAVTLVGNAAPEDPETYPVALLSDSVLTAAITPAAGLTIALLASDGTVVEPQSDDTWLVDTAGDFAIQVSADPDPLTFELSLGISAGTAGAADWIISPTGVAYRGTKLALGDDAETVIEKVIDFLGHGVRSGYGEFDTGWTTITQPGNMGLRGISIGGFAFLFYGPDPANLDRPETLARVRFEGTHPDASGAARPDNYVATSEGVTVGDTVADLKAAYGTRVTLGNNADEYYYRLAESGRELCFYFTTPAAPTDFSPISEIATQCRS
ncbi:MAG: peptidoglycan-binding protein [Acidimicrobiia bacterium]|nr:peptidoglycan-binding protein [Acidimicrobiia bacterium]